MSRRAFKGCACTPVIMISALFLKHLLFQKSEPSSLVQWIDEISTQSTSHSSSLERARSHTLFCCWNRSEEGSLLTERLSCLLWLWTTPDGKLGCLLCWLSVHSRLWVELRQQWWPKMTLCESELDSWPRTFVLFCWYWNQELFSGITPKNLQWVGRMGGVDECSSTGTGT